MSVAALFRPSVAHRSHGGREILALLRPVALLAALAFFAGFGGYLILGPPHVMDTLQAARPAAVVAPAEPASEPQTPDWNPPKQI